MKPVILLARYKQREKKKPEYVFLNCTLPLLHVFYKKYVVSSLCSCKQCSAQVSVFTSVTLTKKLC